MRKLGATIVVLALSRLVGMFREFVIALAFGFSRLTDLFYQATWPLTALLTVANGPFTTAFAAQMAQGPSEMRVANARYYLQYTLKFALVLTGAFWLAGGGAWAFGLTDLALVLAVLSAAAFSLTITGFFYALATACGWITLAAILLFVSNFSFVAGTILFWFLGGHLTVWTLPSLYSAGMLTGLPVCRIIWGRMCNTYPSSRSVATSLPGLGKSFMLAGMETAVFLMTQALIIALATVTAEGWVSAVALVQRVVFSIIGLVISPFASFLMLQVIEEKDRSAIAFRDGFLKAAVGLVTLSIMLGIFVPLMGTHLMKSGVLASADSLPLVLQLLPYFSFWLLPMGLNVIVCRTMFGLNQERLYTISTISGYTAANLARIVVFQVGGFGLAIVAGALVEIGVTLWLATQVGSGRKPSGDFK